MLFTPSDTVFYQVWEKFHRALRNRILSWVIRVTI